MVTLNLKKAWLNFIILYFTLFGLTSLSRLIASGGAIPEASGELIYDALETPLNYSIFLIGVGTLLFLFSKRSISFFVSSKAYIFVLGYIYMFIIAMLFSSNIVLSSLINNVIVIVIVVSFFYYYGISGVVNSLFYSFFIIVILSCISALFFPSYGVSVGIHEGSWQGIFMHKNQFGVFLICFLIIVFIKRMYVGIGRYLFISCIILELIVVVFSQSSTAITLSVYMITLYLFEFLIPAKFRSGLSSRFFYALSLFFVFLFILYGSYFVSIFFDKENSGFSGRDIIWFLGLNLFENNPLFGAIIENINISDYLYNGFGGVPIASFHNSYIESLAIYGIIGSIFLFLPIISIFFVRIRSSFFLKYGIFLSLLVYMFMESILVGKNPIILMLLILFLCGKYCSMLPARRVN